jgi:hypothetical protein
VLLIPGRFLLLNNTKEHTTFTKQQKSIQKNNKNIAAHHKTPQIHKYFAGGMYC